MDPPEEELQQITTWFSEEGLAADSPTEAQLCLLWRALQRTGVRLSSVTWDLDTQRSQHLAEMAEVRKSLEQIRIFTEHKDVLAQEIQDENDQLKDQLRRLISLQDAQISEVAKMLYQQGLTELIHSSPSEQVAYLLVERASFLETSHDADSLSCDGDAASPLGAEAQAVNTNALQHSHKGAPRHEETQAQALKAETRHLACQASSVKRECSRLERDLEEGSRRLAMAHSEIRRLTDELESAHLTQRAYEPELQAAQQEVEQLRQEVEKVKKYEMVELRKAKEMNDRLDLEIRALRSRVRLLDAEKGSLQQMVASLQKELEEKQQMEQQFQANQLKKSEAAELAQSKQTCRYVQQELTAQTRCLVEKEEAVVCLQKEVKRLESVLKGKQQHLEQQLHDEQYKATELIQSNELCRDLHNKLNAQSRCLLEKESEIHSLKQQLDNSQNNLHNLKASLCTKENSGQDQKLWMQNDSLHCENAHCQLKDSFKTEDKDLQNKDNTKPKECLHCQDAVKTLLATRDESETLRKEICETLISLDKERSKNHEMKEKHKAKLCRAREKLEDETMWRDERIKNLERELSLCSHSLAKEKELTISVNVENDKLLVERRRLLQQLNEEEHDKKDQIKTASLSKCRVDFLEIENKKLGNKLLHMSNHIAALERSLQNMQSLHFTEELKKISNPMHFFTSLPVQTLSVMMPELSKIQSFQDNSLSKQSDVTSSRHCLVSGPLSRSAEMGYLNVTSTQSRSDLSTPPAILSSSDSTCS